MRAEAAGELGGINPVRVDAAGELGGIDPVRVDAVGGGIDPVLSEVDAPGELGDDPEGTRFKIQIIDLSFRQYAGVLLSISVKLCVV